MSHTLDSNFILNTDSYKISHWRQYPPNTTKIYSFFESRGGEYDRMMFFGLQYILKSHFAGYRIFPEHIEQAKEIFAAHFGDASLFNEAGWQYIIDEYGGYLPLEIRAVKEGTLVPTRNVLMTVVNTDPKCYWLTNYAETILSQIWYPCTVATQSWHMRQILLKALEKSGDPSGIDFKLHDFGYRGSTSFESSAIGGAAHLVNFKGTDTVSALLLAKVAYGEDMAGYSIPATEHSTITSWGRGGEERAYRNVLEQYPTGLVACVSDSYNIFKACSDLWGNKLKDMVLNRDGVLVIRPDSGEPDWVLPEVLDVLGKTFGYEYNEKDYKVLNPHVRLIQGAGLRRDTLGYYLQCVMNAGWSADNLAWGSGGGLLQMLDRDTMKCAFKCSAAEIDGEWASVKKEPVTDPGKTSKAGRLALIKEAGQFRTIPVQTGHNVPDDYLEPVFRNGELLREQTFAEIRELALQG
jgi:nicotinamide phosphoribosyltransferase